MSERSSAVFISYAHESDHHKADVRALAEFLRNRGVKVTLDQWSEHPRPDWSSWAIKHITGADFVLVVASPAYRLAGDGLGPADDHRGVQSEAALLRDRLHGNREIWLPKLLPVLLPGYGVDDIPMFLQPYTGSHYWVTAFTDRGCEDLLHAITGRPDQIPPPPGQRPARSAPGRLQTAQARQNPVRPARSRLSGTAHTGARLDAAAGQLAQAVGTQWRREEERRRVHSPFPIPVRWRTTD